MKKRIHDISVKGLSCFVALSLVFGVSAMPAFADQEPQAQDAEQQEPVAAVEEGAAQDDAVDEAATQDEGQAVDQIITDPADLPEWIEIVDPEEEAVETPNVLENLATTFMAESNALMGNLTRAATMHDTKAESSYETYAINKPYEKLNLKIDKEWVGKKARTITVALKGYRDVNGNGQLDEKDKEGFKQFLQTYYDAENNEMKPYDANGNGEGGELEDRYFDMNADGQITPAEEQPESSITPPFYYELITFGVPEGKDWTFTAEGLEYWFYNFVPMVYKDTCVAKADEYGNDKLQMFYELQEMAVDEDGIDGSGYEVEYIDKSTADTGAEEDEALSTTDKTIYSTTLRLKNWQKDLEDNGQLIIHKELEGPIYSSVDAKGKVTENSSTAVFHVVGTYKGEEICNTYLGIDLDAETREYDIKLINLPIGAEFTVTEVNYDGSGYEATMQSPKTQEIKYDVRDKNNIPTITFSFTNKSTWEETPNYGVVNNYTQPNAPGSYEYYLNVRQFYNATH